MPYSLLNESHCVNFRIGKVLWESPAKDQVCVIASTGRGQRFALTMPAESLVAARLKAQVRFSLPERAANPGSFDEASWLAGQAVFYKAELEKVLSLEGHRPLLLSWRDQVLKDIRAQMTTLLGSDRAGLVLAICLGDKTGLSGLTKYQLSSLSLAHVTAVSGLQLAFLMLFFRILPLKKCFGLKLTYGLQYTIILAFYFLSGCPSGFMRAGLLVAIRDFSKLLRLRADSLNSLALALAFACLANPFALLNRGLVWSFASAGALFLFSEDLSRKILVVFSFLDGSSARALAVACSCQTAIYLLNRSEQGQFKILSLIWQLPLTFLVQLIFISGLPLLFVTAFYPGILARPRMLVAIVVRFLRQASSLLLQICKRLTTITWPRFFEPQLPPSLVLFIFILLVVNLFSRRRQYWQAYHRKQSWRWKLCAYLLLASYLLLQFIPSFPEVYFLDVGQGDAIVISWGRRHLLLDGGTGDQALKVLLPFMASQGISYFDSALITHAHADHMGATAQLLAWGKIKSLYLPCEFSLAERLAAYLGRPVEKDLIDKVNSQRKAEEDLGQDLLMLAEAKHIPVRRIEAGRQMTWKGSGINRLYGPQLIFYACQASQNDSKFYSDANESGLVVNLHWAGTDLLLTGDMTPRKEALYLSQDKGPVDILKVGHHGAKNVTQNQFLDQAQVQLAIFSVGPNRYGHPSEEVLARLAERDIKSLRTDQDGAIKVTWDFWGLCRVESYKSKKRLSGLE
ncbi:MAG: ComEC/Rec2 family competence protein [Eubacteriales bacterium]|nr:ComEC/Rec2 family competence protein [Clostridiales bacterium]MDY5836185.1 ComEC/Rec2 family competence protein [Eubacteriales bacterium]